MSLNAERPQSIHQIIAQLPRIVSSENLNTIQLIDDQWRKMPNEAAFRDFVSETPDSFRFRVRGSENLLREQEYKELGQFVLDVFVLPHSNVSCERTFSKVNMVKTKSRNKMITSTLQGLIAASECISQVGCMNFKPSEKMLQCMTANTIYGPKASKCNKTRVCENTEKTAASVEIEDMEYDITFETE
ncbi:uncharacterized protein LOC122499634 [Leptopilina heterotoma]|uniref:uncharacterized protein LOC122499634 n=1 Tax=Leptopilina heterotoma TaxID=63436 RepID=UPI001CA92FF2|nr:uncharacterized protein LOC122499634 [Leptopilina heterotoma]